MEKNRWPEFLSSKLQTQNASENASKMRYGLLGVLGLCALGISLNSIATHDNRIFIHTSKLLFLLFFHAVMILGIYLPPLLEKGEKTFARFAVIRDFTSLIFISSLLTFYSVIVFMLSYQIAAGAGDVGASGFLTAIAWINVIPAAAYMLGCIFFILGFRMMPGAVGKILALQSKAVYVLIGLHTALFICLLFGYAETIPVGSPQFFEQFFAMMLFWIFVIASIRFLGESMSESSVPALAALEIETASGRIERSDDILERYKEAFISKRLSSWLSRLSQQTTTCAHEISQYAHDAIGLVSREKPTEIDLRQVDERYRRAENLYKKLEKEQHRFQISVTFLDLSEIETDRTARLVDLYSRECRNAKLELASVRKRIDEKLVALKNVYLRERQEMAAAEIPAPR